MNSPNERSKLRKIRRLAYNDNTLPEAVTMLINEYRQWPKESADRDFIARLMLEKFRVLLEARTEEKLNKLRARADGQR